MNRFTSQRGGTLMGVVVGLLVGLGIALAVSMYLTKAPVNFLNSKVLTRTAEQDVQEAQKNKDWDPNQALQGKKPAAITTPPPAAAAAAASSAPVASSKPVKATPTSADPLGDLAQQKSAAASGVRYFVQVGAFQSQDDALAQRAKVALVGVEAQITERDQHGRVVYRVRVGPYERKQDADNVKARLEDSGLETALVRVAS